MKKLLLLMTVVLTLSSYAGAQERIKITHGPYLQNVSSTEATIVWVSDMTSVGWVELAPDDNSDFYQEERPKFYDSKNGIKTESTVHSVQIKNLKSGTRYRYRVFSQEILSHVANRVIYGNVASTVVYQKEPLSFTTTDATKESVSFAMVNDIHGNNDLLKNLVAKCDLKTTDMFLFVGDMVSIFESEKQVFEGFMDTAVNLFASELPMYYTRGNHETRGSYAAYFQKYFSPRSENIYYMYRQGPVCFVALDSGDDKPDSDIEYAGITVYDEYRSEQVEWLKKVVNSKEFKEAPFKIVTCHMPPFGGWHGEYEVAKKFMPVLNDAGVDIMLCGHLHKYVHNNADEKNKVPIIVNSNNTVLKAYVTEDEMKVTVVDESGKEIDKFVIKK